MLRSCPRIAYIKYRAMKSSLMSLRCGRAHVGAPSAVAAAHMHAPPRLTPLLPPLLHEPAAANNQQHRRPPRAFGGFGSSPLAMPLAPSLASSSAAEECGRCRALMTVARAARTPVADSSGDAGLPFALSRPWKPLRFPWGRRIAGARLSDMRVDVDAMVEGSPSAAPTPAAAEALLRAVQADCEAAVRQALAAKKARAPRWPLPSLASVSLVLCDDAYVRALNAAHRGIDAPTDVLSFEVPDEPGEVPPPVKLLGDLVVSLDTAQRQAAERGHTLEDELRVLLVHGALHLCGFDHERGARDLEDMAAAEAAILAELGWRGAGLIEMAVTAADDGSDDDDDHRTGSSGSGSTSGFSPSSSGSTSSSGSSASSGGSGAYSADGIGLKTGGFRSGGVRLVALDMDGTLLDSNSHILPSSVKAIRAAIDKGVRVVLATGKARPAAVAACEAVGLAGAALDPRGALVSRTGPGVFLQGLAVHGRDGAQLSDAALPPEVVRAAFEWAAARGMSLAAFHGDTLSTLALTPALEELHTRYYEPLPVVEPSVDALLAGPPVRKLLFMDTVERIAGEATPHWAAALAPPPRIGKRSSSSGGTSSAALAASALAGAAELLQALPDMLEVVPVGVNKWRGVELLLRHLGVAAADVMAMGDGGNDTQMVANAGLGIAMANGVAETRAAAAHVVASNDDGGVAEAFERFVL